MVILTSNRTRELHEALRRRCVYHWIDYPAPEREARDRHDARLERRREHRPRGGGRGRTAAARAADQAARHRGSGRLGGGRDRACTKGGASWPDAFKRVHRRRH